jgi:tetratricopeptide (TPR) repeat protein
MRRGIVIILALAAVPAAALAQDAPAEDAAAQPELPPYYEGKLARGHAMYLATDFAGALNAYGAAKDQDAGRPDAYYFIACAQSKLGQHDDAIASLKTAATIAGEKDTTIHAKALFMIGVVQERKSDWKAAKAAWNEYLGYAKSHSDATTFVPSAEGRIEAIDKKIKLDSDYAPVRERLANKGS